MKGLDLSGQRYGKLIAISTTGEIEKGTGSRLWTCKCDCGKQVAVSARYLRKNRLTKSCGCVQTIFVDYSYEKEIIRRYRYGAASKHNIWNLTDDEALRLIRSPCFYCGEVGIRSRKKVKSGGTLQINGIDRLDSSRGYEPDNVVPCCSSCNYRKRDIPYSEFMSWIEKVYTHRLEIAK